MLESLTLLDFSSMGPGPRCTRLLADYGMRVVKIRPPSVATRMVEAPWYAYSANRGIPQIEIDLKQDAGRDLVHRLLAAVDAMVESFRPGVAARLGIGYADVRPTNPTIVYCSVTGYGQSGPYASWPAHDLNWLALGGYLAAGSRSADGAPALPGGTVADTVGGFSTSVAVLSAIVAKLTTGVGAYLDVSVMDGVLRMMQFVLDGHLAGTQTPADAELPPPGMLTGGSACYGVYRAGDGRWLAIGSIEPHFWVALCRGLGLEHRIPDQHRPELQADLRQDIAAAFATRPAQEWLSELGASACITPVNSPADVLADPHLNSRALTVDVQVDGRTVRQLTPRLAIADTPDLDRQPAGRTTPAGVDEALRELGISADEISELRQSGVIH
jgi:alpha-methylacyl-CoA racemase